MKLRISYATVVLDDFTNQNAMLAVLHSLHCLLHLGSNDHVVLATDSENRLLINNWLHSELTHKLSCSSIVLSMISVSKQQHIS